MTITTLQDTKRQKLIDLGYSGPVHQMEKAFYVSEAGSSNAKSFNETQIDFLASKGFTSGTLPDRWRNYLVSLGYTGAVNNMLFRFWQDYAGGAPELGYVFDGYVDVGYYTPE